MRVAIIFHRLGPYHCARLEAAAKHFAVTAIELSAETAEYDWAKVHGAKGYTRVTLFPDGDSRAAAPLELQKRLNAALDQSRPDVVAIPGWSDRGAFAALLWCSRNRKPAVLMSESTAHDEPRGTLKEFVKRRIVSVYSTALVGGRWHADYLQRLGMSADRIFTGYDVVDNNHFAGKADWTASETDEVVASPAAKHLASLQSAKGADETVLSPSRTSSHPRTGSMLASRPYFLASARFIAKKNLSTLLNAYAEYHRTAGSDAWNLMLLGDGPLRPALEAQLASLHLEEHVHMPGFKQYDELPGYYAGAGAFVHASTSEQWGLVVNEAIAAGLPVLVSNRCGCVPELVAEGGNGFSFNPADASELARLMSKVASMSATERERMGAKSCELARHFDAAHFGEGLSRAAQLAVRLPLKRAGLFNCTLLHILVRR